MNRFSSRIGVFTVNGARVLLGLEGGGLERRRGGVDGRLDGRSEARHLGKKVEDGGR